MVTAPPATPSGGGGILGLETLCFPRFQHSSLGPTKEIKAPGLKFQMAEFLKKRGYGRSLEAFYSLSTGNWARITPDFPDSQSRTSSYALLTRSHYLQCYPFYFIRRFLQFPDTMSMAWMIYSKLLKTNMNSFFNFPN